MPRLAALRRSGRTRLVLLLAAVIALVVAIVLSMTIGSGTITPGQVLDVLTGRAPVDATTALLVRDYRVPRTVLGIMVGIALGLAGSLIQAITRNPLAEPGILGVNAGAYFAVVLSATVVGVGAIGTYIWWSLLGAAVATVVVYVIGSRGRSGATAVRLVLTGVAFGAVLSGFSLGVTLLNPEIFDRVRFWLAGSLQNRQMDIVLGVAPFLLVGAILALSLGRALNATALGDDLAHALGSRVLLTRGIGMLALTLLCGGATAAVGPISFFGLLVPFVARAIVGQDQRWILATSVLVAPTLFLLADVLGRVVVSSELPVGIVSAFIGAPILILVVRGRRVRSL